MKQWSGVECFATSGEQPGPSSLERKTYTKAMILISQVFVIVHPASVFCLDQSLLSSLLV